MSNVFRIVVRPKGTDMVVSRVVSGARGGFYTACHVTLPREGFKEALRGEKAQDVIKSLALPPATI